MKRGSCLAWLLLFVLICLASFLASLPVGRWWQFQRLGQVPESVSRSERPGSSDWRVAEWTTWWGKPLDPVKFWQGRVIWNDESAREAAHRFGRAYPPIPEHMTNLVAGFPLGSRSHADVVPDPWSGGPDGGRVAPFHYTDAEHAYWNWFWRKQPKPPATLEREQHQVANTILQMRQPLLFNVHVRIPERERARLEEMERNRARDIGLPPEALTEEALQIRSTNAWKVAYLQRLRREKVDESYIHAYLKAWSIPPAEVFTEDKHE